jgi:hypothetical protein
MYNLQVINIKPKYPKLFFKTEFVFEEIFFKPKVRKQPTRENAQPNLTQPKT